MKALLFVAAIIACACACTNYKVTASSLNVRSGPGTGYKVVGSLKKNAIVCIASISNGWAKISSSKYCSASYITKSSGSTSSPGGSSSNEKTIWKFLYGKIGNKYGVAGLMGNLYAESGLNPKNLQNSYERSLGYTDSSYTSAVDSGKYKRFSSDQAGYGLAQWTYSTRKKNLLNYAKSKGASIGNLTMQLEFLWKELTGSYSAVVKTLKSAKSVKQASNAVLLKFERPANQGTSVQNKRASYGQKYYNKYK